MAQFAGGGPPGLSGDPLRHTLYENTFPASVSPITEPSSSQLASNSSKMISRHTHTRRPRSWLSNLDRKKICQYHDKHPNSTHAHIASIFGVSRCTVTNILKNKLAWYDEHRELTQAQYDLRLPRYEIMEEDMMEWLHDCAKNEIVITDAAIRAQALSVYGEVAKSGKFKASPTWVRAYKRRFGIRRGKLTFPKRTLDDISADEGSDAEDGGYYTRIYARWLDKFPARLPADGEQMPNPEDLGPPIPVDPQDFPAFDMEAYAKSIPISPTLLHAKLLEEQAEARMRDQTRASTSPSLESTGLPDQQHNARYPDVPSLEITSIPLSPYLDQNPDHPRRDPTEYVRSSSPSVASAIPTRYITKALHASSMDLANPAAERDAFHPIGYLPEAPPTPISERLTEERGGVPASPVEVLGLAVQSHSHSSVLSTHPGEIHPISSSQAVRTMGELSRFLSVANGISSHHRDRFIALMDDLTRSIIQFDGLR